MLKVVLNFSDDFPLRFGRLEAVSMAPDGVEGAAGLLHDGLVHVPATPPPAPVQQGLVVRHGEALTHQTLGIIVTDGFLQDLSTSCQYLGKRSEFLAVTTWSGRDLEIQFSYNTLGLA